MGLELGPAWKELPVQEFVSELVEEALHVAGPSDRVEHFGVLLFYDVEHGS